VLLLLAGPTAERFKNGGAPYGCHKATYEVRIAAWNSSKPLYENKPDPMGCPLVIGSLSLQHGLVHTFDRPTGEHSLPVSSATRTTMAPSRIATFVDRISPSQMAFINNGWLLCFV
jgi:hypothetical protein